MAARTKSSLEWLLTSRPRSLQHVEMHMHTSSAASGSGSGLGHISGIDEGPRAPQGILDSLSDTLLNAFSKVRKPDERFESMKERLERLDEGLAGVERVVNRGRVRWTGEYQKSSGCGVS